MRFSPLSSALIHVCRSSSEGLRKHHISSEVLYPVPMPPWKLRRNFLWRPAANRFLNSLSTRRRAAIHWSVGRCSLGMSSMRGVSKIFSSVMHLLMIDFPPPESGATSLRNSRLVLTLRSIALCGWTVAFRNNDEICLYKIEKSLWLMCTEPRTVKRYAGAPCSLASLIRDMAASQFFCQYMNASLAIPSKGRCIRCFGSSTGGFTGALQVC